MKVKDIKNTEKTIGELLDMVKTVPKERTKTEVVFAMSDTSCKIDTLEVLIKGETNEKHIRRR